MKIGYLLPTRDEAVRGNDDLGRLVGLARQSEDLGLEHATSSSGWSPTTPARHWPGSPGTSCHCSVGERLAFSYSLSML
ncbi:hypothetical protein [Microtetraspora niveoalba]|uniref:hypothetical protein n=1 Tax=Microtetraspora niveoalba TaxID=46175 RepID=UPI000B2C9855|nr:hypothetical protein [Microtetraspora niveoalba]